MTRQRLSFLPAGYATAPACSSVRRGHDHSGAVQLFRILGIGRGQPSHAACSVDAGDRGHLDLSVVGSLGGCPAGHHFGGGQPRLPKEAGQSSPPSPRDVQRRSLCSSRSGVLAASACDSHRGVSLRHATRGVLGRSLSGPSCAQIGVCGSTRESKMLGLSRDSFCGEPQLRSWHKCKQRRKIAGTSTCRPVNRSDAPGRAPSENHGSARRMCRSYGSPYSKQYHGTIHGPHWKALA